MGLRSCLFLFFAAVLQFYCTVLIHFACVRLVSEDESSCSSRQLDSESRNIEVQSRPSRHPEFEANTEHVKFCQEEREAVLPLTILY